MCDCDDVCDDDWGCVDGYGGDIYCDFGDDFGVVCDVDVGEDDEVVDDDDGGDEWCVVVCVCEDVCE